MKFTFYATVTVSAVTVVEAATADEAKEIAASRSPAIGGPGSDIDADEYWVIDDADGEADNIRLEDNE